MSSLIGEKSDDDFKSRINKIASEIVLQDINIHHIHIHIYGDHKELTFHIELSPDMKLKDAHKIADEIEKEIKTEMDIETTIYIEPLKKTEKTKINNN
ncbi:cation transporter dimerization domain-containing protein [candidate division KSB1 bacterium]